MFNRRDILKLFGITPVIGLPSITIESIVESPEKSTIELKPTQEDWHIRLGEQYFLVDRLQFSITQPNITHHMVRGKLYPIPNYDCGDGEIQFDVIKTWGSYTKGDGLEIRFDGVVHTLENFKWECVSRYITSKINTWTIQGKWW